MESESKMVDKGTSYADYALLDRSKNKTIYTIGVTKLPGRRRPCLYTMPGESNQAQILAYFKSEQEASLFSEILEMICWADGIIDKRRT